MCGASPVSKERSLRTGPIEALNVLSAVSVDESVQLTIRYIVKDPPVGADVLRRFRQLDACLRIVPRSDDVSSDRALRRGGLSNEKARCEDQKDKSVEQTKPPLMVPV